MRMTDQDLARLYRKESAPPPERPGCPATEVLVAAAASELDAAGRATLVIHLRTCSACAEEFAQLVAAVEAGPEPVAVLSFPVGRRAAAGALWQRAAIGASLAASVLMAVSVVAWRAENRVAAELEERESSASTDATRIAALERRVAELEVPAPPQATPSLNVPIVDLYPSSQPRGGGTVGVRTIRLDPESELVTFVLNLAERPRFERYAVELLSAQGESLWSAEGLKPTRYDTFTLILPAALLPRGEARLRVDGLGDGARQRIEEYRFEVAEASAQ